MRYHAPPSASLACTLVLMLTAVAAVPAPGQDYQDYTAYARWIGSFYAPEPGYGDPFGFRDIEYHEGHLYALTLWSGLYDLDFSQPGDLQISRSLWFEYGAWKLACWGDHLYVSGWWDAMRILRSEPDGFVEVGLLELPSSPSDIAASAGYLFVTMQDELWIYDLQADPEAPVLIRTIELGHHAGAIEVVDGHLFSTTRNFGSPDGLLILGFMTLGPQRLQEMVYLGDDRTTAVHVDGSTVWVAGGGTGLSAIDIRNPARPAVGRRWDLLGWGRAVGAAGTRAFVGAYDLDVVDVATFGATPGDDWFTLPVPNQGAVAMTTIEDHVYLAEYGDHIAGMYRVGVQSYAIGDRPPPPGPAASLDIWPAGENVNDVAARGDLACVVTKDGLSLLSLGAGGEPEPVGSLTFGVADAASAHVASSDQLAVVAVAREDDGVLLTCDVADPMAPALLGTLALDAAPLDVHLAGTLAFVVTEARQLLVVDVADPGDPVVLSSTACPRSNGVTARGNLVAVACWFDGVRLFDVSDPAAPVLLGEVDTTYTGAYRVQFDGDVLHVADDRYYTSVDVSDPTQPVVLGSHDLAWVARDLAVQDGLVYLTGPKVMWQRGSCLQVVDATDPAAPDHLGHSAVAFVSGEAVAMVAGWVVLAAGPQGVHVFAPQCRAPGAAMQATTLAAPEIAGGLLLCVQPNPANPRCEIAFTLPVAGMARVDVFDAAGRHVFRLADRHFPLGPSRVVWNGEDSAGRPAASGIYIVRLHSASGDAARKVALIQ